MNPDLVFITCTKNTEMLTRVGAVETMYQDLAARHRARFRSIHILKVVELEKTDDVKRQYVKQFLTKDLKFPLPHRVQKSKKLFKLLLNHFLLNVMLLISFSLRIVYE